MEVILLERVEKLGQMGDVVNVKPGFARNYLLPTGKARRATKENLKGFERERVQLETRNVEQRSEAETLAAKIEGFTCVLLRQASESTQLYGSVTARDIAEVLGENGFTLHRTQVQLNRPIKTLGIHPVRVALHPEVTVGVNVNVARSQEEAQAQAAATKEPPAGGVQAPAAAGDAEAQAAAPQETPAEDGQAQAAEREKTSTEEGAANEPADAATDPSGEKS